MRRARTWAICILAITAMVALRPVQVEARIPERALDRAETAIGIASLESSSPHGAGGNTGAIQVPSDIADLADFAAIDPGATVTGPKITIYRADTPENFEIGLRLALTSDSAEGDIALRLRTPRDYYVVRLDGRDGRVSFSRVVEGRSHQIVSVERALGANAWHSLRVAAQGNRFTVTLDENWLFTAYDATLRQPGSLAVWTGPQNAMRLDAIAVTPLVPE